MSDDSREAYEGEIVPVSAQGKEIQSSVEVDLGRNMIENSKVYMNLGQEVHIITRDRLELALRKALPRHTDLGALLAKVGIFLALILALLTTDAKKFLGLNAEVWQAILVILTAVAGVWTVFGLIRYFARMTIDDIVGEVIKKSSEE